MGQERTRPTAVPTGNEPAARAAEPDPAVTAHDPAALVAIDPRWAEVAARSDEDPESLACPSCGVDLLGADAFETYRVCPACHRHFPLPARERLRLLVDPDSFRETNAALVSVDPLIFRDLLPLPDRLAEGWVRTGPGGGLGEAIVTGIGAIGGREAVLVVLDHAYLGGGVGPVAGEKIVLAMELAAERRLPLVALCASGAARTQAGLLSLVQLPKIAAAAARLHRAGVPFVSVLAHPTTGGVYVGLANQADLVLAEPGAQIGFGAGGPPRPGATPSVGTNPAETALDHGLVDAVVDRSRLRPTLATLLALFADRGAFLPAASPRPVEPPGHPAAWEEVGFARHPERPTALDYVRRLVADFVELHGDRVGDDDPAVVCGLGRLAGVPVAVVAQERGRGDDAAFRRSGRIGPAGYRKAARVMRLAGHLELPILTFVDGALAARTAGPESADLGTAIAQTLGLTSLLPVPIVSVVVGEGGGIGAIALGAADRTLMLQHAVYVVDEGTRHEAKGMSDESALMPLTFDLLPSLPLTARDCQRLGVVDAVVPEPEPAAHADPEAAAHLLGAALRQALAEVAGVGPRRLLDDRARKVRFLGQSTPEGREAARREVRELQELQRTLVRSLGDLRERWEGRPRPLPRLHLPPLPLPSLPRRAAGPEGVRAGPWHRPDLGDIAGRIAEGVRSRGLGGRESGEPDDDHEP